MPFHMLLSVDQAGDIGGNGISRFAWRNIGGTPASQGEMDGAATFLRTMFVTLAPQVPNAITHTIQPEVPIIDDDSGKIVQFGSLTTGIAAVPGSGGSTPFPAGAGVRVTMHTGTVHNGRVIRGGFFLVPLFTTAYAANGGMSGGAQTTIANAVNAYITSMRNAPHPAVIYHRPLKGQTTGGLVADVLNAVVPGQPTGLRSRRL